MRMHGQPQEHEPPPATQWDSNISVAAYTRKMAVTGWGGGIEMAACARSATAPAQRGARLMPPPAQDQAGERARLRAQPRRWRFPPDLLLRRAARAPAAAIQTLARLPRTWGPYKRRRARPGRHAHGWKRRCIAGAARAKRCAPRQATNTVHVLYCGGVHYNALVPAK